MLAIAEADYAAIPLAKRDDLRPGGGAAMDTDGGAQQNGAAAPAAPELDEEVAAREEQWGAPKGEPGQWASCVRCARQAGRGACRGKGILRGHG